MSILVRNIRMPIDADVSDAFDSARRTAGAGMSCAARVYLKSVDARHEAPVFVYTVELDDVENENAVVKKANNPDVVIRPRRDFALQNGTSAMTDRPVVCGFGPAGMFAALILARYGLRPIVIERGGELQKRISDVDLMWKAGILDSESNVQFGEGGAGTFSDGKLTTRINDPLCEFVLGELVRCGAPEEILSAAHPHIGTDRLRTVVCNMRRSITELGGEVLFNRRLDDVSIKNGALEAVTVNGGSFACRSLLLCIGHSARDTYAMLMRRGITMEPKPFSIGVRAEHLQADIDKSMYGKYAGHAALPPAEYRLSWRNADRACYTFCMCPGGTVVCAASEEGGLAVNGMSCFARDGINANSAVVVSVEPGDFGGAGPLAGVEFQRRWERAAFAAAGGKYAAPVQTFGSFIDRIGGKDTLGSVRPSYTGETRFCDLHGCLPDFVCSMIAGGMERFSRKVSCFSKADTLFTGIETRTSAPLRILRGEDRQSVSAAGIYPCGEGAGYAGGIMSAAVDGIKTAARLVELYAPF